MSITYIRQNDAADFILAIFSHFVRFSFGKNNNNNDIIILHINAGYFKKKRNIRHQIPGTTHSPHIHHHSFLNLSHKAFRYFPRPDFRIKRTGSFCCCCCCRPSFFWKWFWFWSTRWYHHQWCEKIFNIQKKEKKMRNINLSLPHSVYEWVDIMTSMKFKF